MVAPYAGTKPIPAEQAGTAIFIPVTNPLERLNKEVKRRADVVGIFPNEASITRLIGAVLLEQNDVYGPSRRLQADEPIQSRGDRSIISKACHAIASRCDVSLTQSTRTCPPAMSISLIAQGC